MTTRFAQRFVDSPPEADRFLVRHVDTALRVALGDQYLLRAAGIDAVGETTCALLFALVDDLELNDQGWSISWPMPN
jgi:hypothetical protein